MGGFVAPGFDGVLHAFRANFGERGELGAAFAAYQGNRAVVDLWGGVADPVTGTAWQEDTICVIFSGGKGLVATCLLKLVERGQLELDAPVARYWPAFAQAGKGDTLVRHVVAHEAGLPGVRRPLAFEQILDPEVMVGLLEAEAPYWPAGERACYHPLTFGWLCGELVRRVDGRSLGRFFAEEVAGPLALDAWFGLPEAHEPRVATLVTGADWGAGARQQASSADPLAATVWDNPPDRFDEPLPQNASAFHRAEVAGGGAIADARSMARLYACLANGGELDGRRLLAAETVALGRRCLSIGTDPFIGQPLRFGVGFELQTSEMSLGPSPQAFGHGGLGGSVHAAWPEHGIGFSYTMNELRTAEPDPRAQAVLHALYESASRQGATAGAGS